MLMNIFHVLGTNVVYTCYGTPNNHHSQQLIDRSSSVNVFIYWTFVHSKCYVLSTLLQPILIKACRITGVKGTISNQYFPNFSLDNGTRNGIYDCHESIATNMFSQKMMLNTEVTQRNSHSTQLGSI